jgi:hypothetical protein
MRKRQHARANAALTAYQTLANTVQQAVRLEDLTGADLEKATRIRKFFKIRALEIQGGVRDYMEGLDANLRLNEQYAMLIRYLRDRLGEKIAAEHLMLNRSQVAGEDTEFQRLVMGAVAEMIKYNILKPDNAMKPLAFTRLLIKHKKGLSPADERRLADKNMQVQGAAALLFSLTLTTTERALIAEMDGDLVENFQKKGKAKEIYQKDRATKLVGVPFEIPGKPLILNPDIVFLHIYGKYVYLHQFSESVGITPVTKDDDKKKNLFSTKAFNRAIYTQHAPCARWLA